MNEGNGNGAAGALALRPALKDTMQRQAEVLAQLETPFTSAAAVTTWTVKAYHAAVGRAHPGMVDMLSNPDFAPFVHVYLLHKGPMGEQFRARLALVLAAEYGRALEDLSRISGEFLPTSGIGNGALSPLSRATTYR